MIERSLWEAMQIVHVVHLLRPFHGGDKREIVSRHPGGHPNSPSCGHLKIPHP